MPRDCLMPILRSHHEAIFPPPPTDRPIPHSMRHGSRTTDQPSAPVVVYAVYVSVSFRGARDMKIWQSHLKQFSSIHLNVRETVKMLPGTQPNDCKMTKCITLPVSVYVACDILRCL